MKNIKLKLTLLSFLQLAAWGAYLISMPGYLNAAKMGEYIGYFYAMIGGVSIFMPAIIGTIADRYIPAQKTLSICHFIAGSTMIILGIFGHISNTDTIINFPIFLSIFTISIAFYMPTIGLSNSVSYNAIEKAGFDIVKVFPYIRVWGTIGFIIIMWVIDISGLKNSSYQFLLSGIISLAISLYSLSLPSCPVEKSDDKLSLAKVLGLDAFVLFKDKRLALFFIFSMLLGVSLQITNGYAAPYMAHFSVITKYQNSFAVQHPIILLSISQISESLCILLIPFVLKRFGIKKIMLMSMAAWVIRFYFLAIGNPGNGIPFFIISMLIYGMAFDFFNVSGSIFVDEEVKKSMRSSAQGLFMLMTNGLGATIGMLGAQKVVNYFCYFDIQDSHQMLGDWNSVWYIFAFYALVVMILFAILFNPNKSKSNQKNLEAKLHPNEI